MIEVHELTKQFGDLLAVDRVTLSVARGEVLALLGSNGAGKTTTIRMLTSVLTPSSGWARVAGYDVVTQGQQVRQSVGLLTEAPGLYIRMTGREYLTFFGQAHGLTKAEALQRIDCLADRFRLTFDLDRRLGEYSKGMTQKVALMRALLHDPAVLFLDEPTSAMDPESARLVRDMILQLRDGQDRTLIICTHNLPEADELADRIAIIRSGRIVALGTPAELKSRFLGPPMMELHYLPSSQDGIVPLVSQYATVITAGQHWLRYSTPDPNEANPQVLRALAAAGIPVVTLSEVPRSLESVYLRVAGEVIS